MRDGVGEVDVSQVVVVAGSSSCTPPDTRMTNNLGGPGMSFWKEAFDVVDRLGAGMVWSEKEHTLDPRYVKLARDAVSLYEVGKLDALTLAKLAGFDSDLLRLLASGEPFPPVGIKNELAIREMAKNAKTIAIERELTPPSQEFREGVASNWSSSERLLADAITRMCHLDFAVFSDRNDDTAYVQMVRDFDEYRGPLLYLEASAGIPNGPNARTITEHQALIALGWYPPDKTNDIPNYQLFYTPRGHDWCDFVDALEVSKMITSSLQHGFGISDPGMLLSEQGRQAR